MSHAFFIESWSLKESLGWVTKCFSDFSTDWLWIGSFCHGPPYLTDWSSMATYVLFIFPLSRTTHCLGRVHCGLPPLAFAPASDQLRFFVHSSSLLEAAAGTTSFTGLLCNPVSVTPAQQHFRVSLEYFRMLILRFFCIDSAWPGWRPIAGTFTWVCWLCMARMREMIPCGES